MTWNATQVYRSVVETSPTVMFGLLAMIVAQTALSLILAVQIDAMSRHTPAVRCPRDCGCGEK